MPWTRQHGPNWPADQFNTQLQAMPANWGPPAQNQHPNPVTPSMYDLFIQLIRLPYDHPQAFFVGAIAISAGFINMLENKNPVCDWQRRGLPASDVSDSFNQATRNGIIPAFQDINCGRLAREMHHAELLKDNTCDWFIYGTPAEEAVQHYRRISPNKKSEYDKNCEKFAKARFQRIQWDQNQDIKLMEKRINSLEKSIQNCQSAQLSSSKRNHRIDHKLEKAIKEYQQEITALRQEIEQIKNPPPKKNWLGF